jgi:hypothetical protein
MDVAIGLCGLHLVSHHKHMFDDFFRERQIRRALKAVARQRVAMVLQPGNIEVIERGTPDEEWFELGVRTCHIRGWVEVLHENLPTGAVRFQGSNPQFSAEMASKNHYRLTEGGWAVLNRSHGWVLATFLVSTIGLVVAAVSLVVSWLAVPQSGESAYGNHAMANPAVELTVPGVQLRAAQVGVVPPWSEAHL